MEKEGGGVEGTPTGTPSQNTQGSQNTPTTSTPTTPETKEKKKRGRKKGTKTMDQAVEATVSQLQTPHETPTKDENK